MILSFKKFAFTFLLISVSYLPVFTQQGLIPGKYLKIVPGVSTRADVDRKYGKATSSEVMVDYQEADFIVGVEYSYLGCENLSWAMPKDVVEEVSYTMRDEIPLRLKDVILDPSKFTRRQEGDVLNHITYRNRENGISLTYDTTRKIVMDVTLEPTSKLKRQFACKEK